jgi:hypothetical protein
MLHTCNAIIAKTAIGIARRPLQHDSPQQGSRVGHPQARCPGQALHSLSNSKIADWRPLLLCRLDRGADRSMHIVGGHRRQAAGCCALPSRAVHFEKVGYLPTNLRRQQQAASWVYGALSCPLARAYDCQVSSSRRLHRTCRRVREYSEGRGFFCFVSRPA